MFSVDETQSENQSSIKDLQASRERVTFDVGNGKDKTGKSTSYQRGYLRQHNEAFLAQEKRLHSVQFD